MTEYRNNHYVPVWYQERFLPPELKEKKFYYLDLKPQAVVNGKHTYTRNALNRWGAKKCFCQYDLYTTEGRTWMSTEIEQKFFGPIDGSARSALEYFSSFTHPSADAELFRKLLIYLSIQKLRTPKGLKYLSEAIGKVHKNQVLMALQRLQELFCALWAECVWSVVDASNSPTKFLLSDHPVTVYNSGFFPGSKECAGHRDPEPRLAGTHTLFPLDLDKLLILTNLCWVRYPYGNPVKFRPNPNPFRPAVFDFRDIQVGRSLLEREVVEINYVIKARAFRYIAAAKKDWLYPEKRIGIPDWGRIGQSYLFMPDPRAVPFSGEIIFGYASGKADAFDVYGRRPWQSGYDNKAAADREWETFHAFQGEFARRFGSRRRGFSYMYGSLSPEIDSAEMHAYYLKLEQRHKKYRYKAK